jgi:hypothetical protein
MEYAQAVMQGQVELFFAVQEVIREECYMWMRYAHNSNDEVSNRSHRWV